MRKSIPLCAGLILLVAAVHPAVAQEPGPSPQPVTVVNRADQPVQSRIVNDGDSAVPVKVEDSVRVRTDPRDPITVVSDLTQPLGVCPITCRAFQASGSASIASGQSTVLIQIPTPPGMRLVIRHVAMKINGIPVLSGVYAELKPEFEGLVASVPIPLKAQFAPPVRFAGSETVSLFHDGSATPLQVVLLISPLPALPGSATAMVSGTLEPIPQP